MPVSVRKWWIRRVTREHEKKKEQLEKGKKQK